MVGTETLSSVAAEQELTSLGGIPVDRVAARVIGSGENYVPRIRPQLARYLSETPFPVLRSKDAWKSETQANVGRRHGRLTIISRLSYRHWQARCDCGIYFKLALDQFSFFTMCHLCRHVDDLAERRHRFFSKPEETNKKATETILRKQKQIFNRAIRDNEWEHFLASPEWHDYTKAKRLMNTREKRAFWWAERFRAIHGRDPIGEELEQWADDQTREMA